MINEFKKGIPIGVSGCGGYDEDGVVIANHSAHIIVVIASPSIDKELSESFAYEKRKQFKKPHQTCAHFFYIKKVGV